MNLNLFQDDLSLTFDDVLIIPGYAEILPSETNVSTQLTPEIKLRNGD